MRVYAKKESGKMIKTIGGLRVYVDPDGTQTHGAENVFYSQREEGPCYLWRYEEPFEKWRFLRLHPSNLRYKKLCTRKWGGVPATLQAVLAQHYLE